MKSIICKIAIVIVLFLIVITTVQAISIPLPVAGKVIGDNVRGLDIEVKNIRTGETELTQTTYSGEWLVDWANSIRGAKPGDTFQAKIIATGDFEQVVWNGEPMVFIELAYVQEQEPCVCEEDNTWVSIGAGATFGIIVALVAFMGGGLKIYKNRLGKMTIQHRHKGIRAYHDPNIEHRNPKYRHTTWDKDPLKCAEDVKKIQEKGGLV